MERISLPLKDGGSYEVSNADAEFWGPMFPSLDVAQEFRNMAAWLYGNPTKRKTKRGITRFISGWLISEGKSAKVQRHIPQDAPALGRGWARRYCWYCQIEYEIGCGDGEIFCSPECEQLQTEKLAGSRRG